MSKTPLTAEYCKAHLPAHTPESFGRAFTDRAIRQAAELCGAGGGENGSVEYQCTVKVSAAYHSLKPEDMPKNDLEKRDLWMVIFSKTVNRNLGPFFQAWGIPVSKKALESIENISPWIPLEIKELVKP